MEVSMRNCSPDRADCRLRVETGFAVGALVTIICCGVRASARLLLPALGFARFLLNAPPPNTVPQSGKGKILNVTLKPGLEWYSLRTGTMVSFSIGALRKASP